MRRARGITSRIDVFSCFFCDLSCPARTTAVVADFEASCFKPDPGFVREHSKPNAGDVERRHVDDPLFRRSSSSGRSDSGRSEGDQFVAHIRSEEHTSELQSLMRISYAVFCLKKKTIQ